MFAQQLIQKAAKYSRQFRVVEIGLARLSGAERGEIVKSCY